MDASRKIKRKNFLAMKQFVQLLSDDLEISKDGSHLGIIHYSKYPHVDFTPHDAYYYDRKRCRAKIESLVYTKGNDARSVGGWGVGGKSRLVHGNHWPNP